MRLFDIPGHKLIVHEMIRGASMADIAILIISSRMGEYISGLKGQTLEHVMITRAMGITDIIVAINKTDTIDYDPDKYNSIVKDFDKKIKKFHFKNIIYLPISALHGINIFERYDTKIAKFSLIEAINSINIIPRETKLIKPIDHKVKGRFVFHHIKNIISIGFKCKIHTRDQLYDAEIVEIKNDNLPFITQKNSKRKQIYIILKLNTIELIYANAIIRNCNETIAVGILL